MRRSAVVVRCHCRRAPVVARRRRRRRRRRRLRGRSRHRQLDRADFAKDGVGGRLDRRRLRRQADLVEALRLRRRGSEARARQRHGLSDRIDHQAVHGAGAAAAGGAGQDAPDGSAREVRAGDQGTCKDALAGTPPITLLQVATMHVGAGARAGLRESLGRTGEQLAEDRRSTACRRRRYANSSPGRRISTRTSATRHSGSRSNAPAAQPFIDAGRAAHPASRSG